MRVCSFTAINRVHKIINSRDRIRLVYAVQGRGSVDTGGRDIKREREQLKEWLKPLVKETVQKQFKEEREYYKSHPSMAARYYGGLLKPEYMEAAFTETVAGDVYGRVEERLRMKRIRTGR